MQAREMRNRRALRRLARVQARRTANRRCGSDEPRRCILELDLRRRRYGAGTIYLELRNEAGRPIIRADDRLWEPCLSGENEWSKEGFKWTDICRLCKSTDN